MTLSRTQIRRHLAEIAAEPELISPRTLERENRALAKEQKRTGRIPINCYLCPLFRAHAIECTVFVVLREPCRTGEIARENVRREIEAGR